VKTDRLLRTKPCSCGGTCPKCSGGERTLRRKATGPAHAEHAPAVVHNVLSSPGRALDTSTRGFFEGRFGHDFSRVRVHADTQAAESARAVEASAYTVGSHIVFDQGKYDPVSREGKELMAHELTHTIQQDQAARAGGPIAIGSPQDASEREADGAASSIFNAERVAVESGKETSIQRQLSVAPPQPHSDAGQGLVESASPFLAASIASVTIDGFVTGKSDISPANQAHLATSAARIQTLLKKYPGSSVNVTGHTDAIGKESDNQTLGQSRADAVKDALAGMGVPPQVMHAESKGETQLLVKTEKAEPRNRRVEVRFIPESRPSLHLAPDLNTQPPAPEKTFEAPHKPIDLKLHTLPQEGLPGPRKQSVPDAVWKPIPDLKKSAGSSLDDKINRLAGKITSFLPESIRKKAQGLVKDAIEKGITSGLDAGLKAAGVDDQGRKAVGKAVEAAIQEKTGGNP
jgi:outer membrane protein OmpA-like peptidoglycan-associated protein